MHNTLFVHIGNENMSNFGRILCSNNKLLKLIKRVTGGGWKVIMDSTFANILFSIVLNFEPSYFSIKTLS